MPKREKVTVSLSRDTVTILNTKVQTEGRSRAELVREAIRKVFRGLEKEPQNIPNTPLDGGIMEVEPEPELTETEKRKLLFMKGF